MVRQGWLRFCSMFFSKFPANPLCCVVLCCVVLCCVVLCCVVLCCVVTVLVARSVVYFIILFYFHLSREERCSSMGYNHRYVRIIKSSHENFNYFLCRIRFSRLCIRPVIRVTYSKILQIALWCHANYTG